MGGGGEKIEINEGGGKGGGGGKENHEYMFTVEKKIKILGDQGVPERAMPSRWAPGFTIIRRGPGLKPPIFWSKLFLLKTEEWGVRVYMLQNNGPQLFLRIRNRSFFK